MKNNNARDDGQSGKDASQTAANLKEFRVDLKDKEPKADASLDRMEAFAEELRAWRIEATACRKAREA
jgi:hypothetical protein